VLVLLAGGVLLVGAIMFYLVDVIQERVKQELTRHTALRHVQFHRERTLGGIQADLALARKMADSDVLRRWVRKPGDANTSAPAMRELGSLLGLFSTGAAFVASRPAASFYFVDAKALAGASAAPLQPVQSLTADDKDDDWFFKTLIQSEPYNFNVDHNATLNVTKVWINVVMKDEGGKEAIGVVGTGIDISLFIDAFIKSKEKGISGIYVNEDGAIQGHADTALIALNAPIDKAGGGSTIWKLIPSRDEQEALKSAMARVKAGEVPAAVLPLTVGGVPQVGAVAYIAPLKWYTVALLDSAEISGSSFFVPIMAVLMLALVLIGGMVLVFGNRLVVGPLRRIAEATRRVAGGEYATRLDLQRSDEIGELATAFNQMAEKLAESQHAAKTNVALISAELQRASTYPELAQAFFSRTAPLLELGQGSLYRVAGQEQLLLCGGYARLGESSPVAEIAFGEGLPGECARERRVIQIDAPPPGYFRVASVLGESSPAALALLPVLSGEKLVGVVELAPLRPLSSDDMGLLGSLLPVLGMSMEIIDRDKRTLDLLSATREQSAELAARQEEIGKLLTEQQAIFENAPQGILYTGDGMIIRANKRIARDLGRTVDELVGQPASIMYVSQESYREFGGIVGPQLGAGREVRLEWEYARKGGGSFPAMVSGQGISVAGYERAAIWLFEDISERKRLEQAMRENELRLQQILEDSPAAVTMVTETGEQIFVNRRLAELLGVPQSQFKTRRSSEFWADPEERKLFIQRLRDEGRIDDYATRFRRDDGTEINVVLHTRWVEQGGKRLLLTWMFEVADRSPNGVQS